MLPNLRTAKRLFTRKPAWPARPSSMPMEELAWFRLPGRKPPGAESGPAALRSLENDYRAPSFMSYDPAETRHFIVIGSSDAAADLEDTMREAGLPTHRRSTPEAALALTRPDTHAVLIVPPIPNISAAKVAKKLRRQHRELPVYLAVHGTLAGAATHKLFRNGVQAIFRWPADEPALLRTLDRIVDGDARHHARSQSAADLALRELVGGRLDAAGLRRGEFRVRASERSILLSGSIDALWELALAEDIASRTPGVRAVSSADVEVRGEATSDHAIAAAARQLLSRAERVDASTLALAVDQGVVTVTGSASGRSEVKRTEELIRCIRGVQRVSKYVTVAPKAKRRDKQVARAVKFALTSNHPRADVEVAVFGGIAVLSGQVADRSVGRRLASVATAEPGVHRVVNQLACR